jgi:hypothetical protein
MEDKYKYLVFYGIIIIILFFFYIILPLLNRQDTVHVIFTRYKEPDMSVLLKPFIDRKNVHVYIYNKGDDIPYGIPDDACNVSIIDIPNLGWDSYGYISYVINNYYNLPTYIANLHASSQYLDNKYHIYNEIVNYINNILKDNENKMSFYGGGVYDVQLDFRLENWSATLDINKQSTHKYTKSTIYPLKKWLESKIIKIPENIMINDKIKTNYLGQFLVNKSKILKYKRSMYKEILDEISVWQSEVNHYLERSWYALYSN